MRYQRHPNTAGRVVDGQAFVITGASNMLHTLNASGTTLWAISTEPFDLEAATKAICIDYEIDENTARVDAETFIDELVARQILVELE